MSLVVAHWGWRRLVALLVLACLGSQALTGAVAEPLLQGVLHRPDVFAVPGLKAVTICWPEWSTLLVPGKCEYFDG